MSQRAMSMPLIVWVRVPPRPIQKLFWWSFSVTRSGSRAFSPRNSGSSTASPASTSRPSVKTLPCPMTPASVCTAISAWIESSRLISVDQPPFGLSPSSGTAAIETMRTGELVDIAASSIDPMRVDEIEIDLDADAGKIGYQHGPISLELERGLGDAARQRALADIELD